MVLGGRAHRALVVAPLVTAVHNFACGLDPRVQFGEM